MSWLFWVLLMYLSCILALIIFFLLKQVICQCVLSYAQKFFASTFHFLKRNKMFSNPQGEEVGCMRAIERWQCGRKKEDVQAWNGQALSTRDSK